MFFFFNDTATTEIYTLSLHDALPIFGGLGLGRGLMKEHTGFPVWRAGEQFLSKRSSTGRDRKSTRLHSSHDQISYLVFCLKKQESRALPGNTTATGSRPRQKPVQIFL